MSTLALAIALVFVLIPVFLSKTFNLGLEKDTIIAVVRSIIQLFVVGYILMFVFDSESILYMLLMVVVMIVAATQNARKKVKQLKGSHGK